MPTRSSIALTLLVAVLLCATSTGAAEPVPCARTFEFVAPEDWRCAEEASPQCTVCRNRSLHYTELLVRCVDDGTRERQPMPPGATLSICGGRAL